MDVRTIRLKEQTVLELYLISEHGKDYLGDYTFPPNSRILKVDDKVIGRTIDIMTSQQLMEWGYNGQEMWIAQINEEDYINA